MLTKSKFECGDRILVIWDGSKHHNKYGVILKIGQKKLTVRFTDGKKGFVFLHHAVISDSCESDPAEISIYDSEGCSNIDEHGWPIGYPSEIRILD